MSVFVTILVKSLIYVQEICSLLKLPEEIQNALRENAIGVSQGYIFVANLDHPKRREIFPEALGEGFTNAGPETELKRGQKPAKTENVRKHSFSLFRRSVRSVRSGIEEQTYAFRKSDLEALLTDLRELVALVEGRLPGAIDDGGAAADAPAESERKKSESSATRAGVGGGKEEK